MHHGEEEASCELELEVLLSLCSLIGESTRVNIVSIMMMAGSRVTCGCQ